MDVPADSLILDWDGCSYYRLRMDEHKYTLDVSLATEDDQVITANQTFTLERCCQALIYAIPARDTLYLGDKDDLWFVEYDAVRDGIMYADFYPQASTEEEPVYRKKINAVGKSVRKWEWNGVLSGKNVLPAGQYRVRMYMD